MRTWLILLAAGMSLATTIAAASDSLSHGKIPFGEQANSQKATEAFQAGHYDVAETIYQTMAEDHPGSRYAWSNLGVARFQQGKLKEARDAFQHAVDLDPKDAAVGLNPDDASAHQFLGNACEKIGLKEEAKAEQKIASELGEKELAAAKQPAPSQH